MLYPASGMLVMAIEAVKWLSRMDNVVRGYVLKNVQFIRLKSIADTR